MKTILAIGVPFVTILFMVAVGMELEEQHFREVVRRKWTFMLTLAGQVIVLPTLAFVLTRVMTLPPYVNAGILLLAACPVGDIANFYTLLARGNMALSVSLNTLSCLLSILTMTVVFNAYGHLLVEHFVFEVPTPTLVLRLTLMVVLPVLAGMLIRRFKPAFVERHMKHLRNGSITGVVFLIVCVSLTQRELLMTEWQRTAVVSALFIGLALLIGFAFGRILRLKVGDSVTLGIVFSVRNVALAVAIAVTLLSRTEFAVFAVVYFLTEVPLLLSLVAVYRRWWGERKMVPRGHDDITVEAQSPSHVDARNEGIDDDAYSTR